jgi:malonyl CoA-acyl carrier protein transacylase
LGHVLTAATVLMFPGQGSQKRGMGQGLFDESAEFRGAEREIDALLGYSLRRLCLEDPRDQLRRTEYAQPSLYVVNALHYDRLRATDGPPSFLAGHSLGEYNALLAAGAFDFMTGLRLVKRRGEVMAQAGGGAMAAVLGLGAAALEAALRDHALTTLDIANVNAPAQLVVSGPAADVARAGPVLQSAGARAYVPLPVSAAFHSRAMAGAQAAFADVLGGVEFAPLRVPVVANATGRPYPAGQGGPAIRALLVRQITSPVLWTQSIQFLLGEGASRFTEVGPGSVLTRLLEQIRREPGGPAA